MVCHDTPAVVRSVHSAFPAGGSRFQFVLTEVEPDRLRDGPAQGVTELRVRRFGEVRPPVDKLTVNH